MAKMKYIRYTDSSELPVIIIFSLRIDHNIAARNMMHSGCKIVSAGFISLYDDGLSCFGRSDTLKLDSIPKEDEEILKRQIDVYSE